ncbi:MAG: hydroxymethylglutaryl-CoA lyase [Gammaproteobacteria bacterium AqS3]|nr:hydroxymethylglutaryl-CoA lyase [Gammaproteobacteria bacterium AqS3]
MIDVTISEVGPRDGLQNIDCVLPTADKLRWIEALAAAGLPEIEVGSCVSPKLLPQMADTVEVARSARTLDVQIAVLVPNLKGVERILPERPDKISLPLSVSETHSRRNVNRSHEEMFAEIAAIAGRLKELPKAERPHFEVGLSTAFGCTIEGPVSEALVVDLAVRAVRTGADEVGLSDTTGCGNPSQVRRLIRAVRSEVGSEKLTGIHLHNTRGQGLANALAALEEGLTTLDASLGGLGGCPFAPGASGNIVTEDLVFMLEAMGLNTGVDFDALMRAREALIGVLPREIPIFGFTPDAGLPLGMRVGAR